MSLLQHQPATPDRFLADHEAQRDWTLPAGVVGFEPIAAFDGRGTFALEVALATVEAEPSGSLVRDLWTKRHGAAPNPLLAVVAYRDGDRWAAALCGPAGDQPPVISKIELAQAERLAEAALAEPSRHAALRFLTAMLPETGADLPGLRNHGMFASHELRDRVPGRADWHDLCEQARPLLSHRGRDLIERLGFRVEEHGTTTSVLAAGENKRAVAVFLDEGEVFEEPTLRFEGASPVAHALAAADRENLPWAVLTRGRQIRVYSARPDVGVGRKGRAETFVEANLALLPDEQSGFLPLLFSAAALLPGGSFEQVLEESRDYAADLSTRLRDRVYKDAVPALAAALAERRGEATLDEVYDQALNVLFRLLFVAYAEDKDLLPYRSNGLYRERSLKSLARHLAERREEPHFVFDDNDTSLWDQVVALWRAIDVGNVELGVPAYNGGLFSSDPTINPAGAALAGVRLSNAEFGPALAALTVDETNDEVVGPVDFRSLSVREFGTIYEGLLESKLSTAPSDLTLDAKANYVPARAGDEVVVAEHDVYFHNRSGSRKATGSYFTKPFAVEHLLDHALEPGLAEHVDRLGRLLDEGEEAKAAQAFFDFRCVDLAMGSGHFLVAAVDRVEARLSAFVAQRPIPQLAAELERLRAAAYEALGALGEGIEIEHSSLLRRQVARRCIYGVDRNVIAVELARLAMWIHTFVPGLPLSFLDHALVQGDSLVGVGSIEEALDALDPGNETQLSMLREPILNVLGRAETALDRLGRLSDATAAEVKDARTAHAEAIAEIEPARNIFDLIVGARAGVATLPASFDEATLEEHPGLPASREVVGIMKALHFPIAFPEVFLRERSGFDVIIGNPPWEEIMVDENAFWSIRFPGFRGRGPAEQRAVIDELKVARPDLLAEFERETQEAATVRLLVSSGQYPGLTEGNADLYKCFAWRFWQLAGVGGRIGVVLPRGALSGAGLATWRETAATEGRFSDVATLLNRREWVFADVHEQYVVGLVSIEKGAPDGFIRLSGPFESVAELKSAQPYALGVDQLAEMSEAFAFPQVLANNEWPIFLKLAKSPTFHSPKHGWTARPVQGDFNATTDRQFVLADALDGWPSYKGASIELWSPDTGVYFGRSDPSAVRSELLARRRRQARRRSSVFAELPAETLEDDATLPIEHPRLAFRDITNRLNERTVIVALIPPHVVLTNSIPYLLLTRGDARDEAYLLGVMSTIPFDWYARRVVERHLNFFLLRSLPVPYAARDHPLRSRVESIAGRLAAVDERFAGWAKTVGVQAGDLPSEDEAADMTAELDATVSLLYGLSPDEIRFVFETFHSRWNYQPRLDLVLDHFNRLS